MLIRTMRNHGRTRKTIGQLKIKRRFPLPPRCGSLDLENQCEDWRKKQWRIQGAENHCCCYNLNPTDTIQPKTGNPILPVSSPNPEQIPKGSRQEATCLNILQKHQSGKCYTHLAHRIDSYCFYIYVVIIFAPKTPLKIGSRIRGVVAPTVGLIWLIRFGASKASKDEMNNTHVMKAEARCMHRESSLLFNLLDPSSKSINHLAFDWLPKIKFDSACYIYHFLDRSFLNPSFFFLHAWEVLPLNLLMFQHNTNSYKHLSYPPKNRTEHTQILDCIPGWLWTPCIKKGKLYTNFSNVEGRKEALIPWAHCCHTLYCHPKSDTQVKQGKILPFLFIKKLKRIPTGFLLSWVVVSCTKPLHKQLSTKSHTKHQTCNGGLHAPMAVVANFQAMIDSAQYNCKGGFHFSSKCFVRNTNYLQDGRVPGELINNNKQNQSHPHWRLI